MTKKKISKAKHTTKTQIFRNTNSINFFYAVVFVLLVMAGYFFVFQFNVQSAKYPLPIKTPTTTPTMTPTPTYETGAASLLSSSNYTKRNFNPNETIEGRTATIYIYPPSIVSTLSAIPDSNLIGTQCAPWIEKEKNNQYTYFLDNTGNLPKTLGDEQLKGIITMINQMAPKDKVITGYFICKSEDGNFIANYTTYKNIKNADILNRTYYFVKVTPDMHMTPITSIYNPGWSSCDIPLELTKDNILYYKCREGDGTAGHTMFYKIDINKQTSELLLQCDIDTEIASQNCH